MLARLASLRVWLVMSMTLAALSGLAVARFVLGDLGTSTGQTEDLHKAHVVAAAVVAQSGGPQAIAHLRTLQSVLPNDEILVYRHGRLVFAGGRRGSGDLELVVRHPFSGGLVVLRDYSSPTAVPSPWSVILVAGGVVALVIFVAVGTATVVVGAVRRPVERAVAAARRVAGGDLSARIGATGPEELAELGGAFDEMARRLEQADRDQRQFLADVAHEIATPLNIISGFALGLADGELRDPQDVREASAVVHSETDRVRDLLHTLRELTRLDLLQPAPAAPVELSAVLGDLLTRFTPTADEARIALRVRGAGVIHTDRRLLDTVLDNLVSNALRYTPAGGEVTVTARRRQHACAITVRDTGIGIPAGEQARIFDRFYRVDAARDRASGGTGIGLALAQRAARAIGGRIALESTPGKGSEFRLVLDRDVNGAPPPAAELPAIASG